MMKQILFISAILYGINADRDGEGALPPGYEDQIWCPPDNCEIYTNPYGYVGALSSFYLCYNPTTNVTNKGVWTGNLTNVTAPDDYIEPTECNAFDYSECNTDEDCSVNEDPGCECYVTSVFHPFDPCTDSWSPTSCNEDRCPGYEDCDEKLPSCYVGNDGVGICGMNDPPSPTASPIVKPKIPARCDTDDQCFARLRTAISMPSNIGVDLCECYAASTVDVFDECEDTDGYCMTCYGDGCTCGNACQGLEAFCDEGECELQSSEVMSKFLRTD